MVAQPLDRFRDERQRLRLHRADGGEHIVDRVERAVFRRRRHAHDVAETERTPVGGVQRRECAHVLTADGDAQRIVPRVRVVVTGQLPAALDGPSQEERPAAGKPARIVLPRQRLRHGYP